MLLVAEAVEEVLSDEPVPVPVVTVLLPVPTVPVLLEEVIFAERVVPMTLNG